jgi:tetratricopeptide (TPR) repeat protein
VVSLSRSLRGDVDWIVMKALDKNRARRYETVLGFAADIEHHLRHEPVAAGPPSAAYRFRKFARRNRGALTAIATTSVAVLIGFVTTAVGFQQASQEREVARQHERDAEAVTEFLTNMLSSVDPTLVPNGREISVLEVLDESSGKIAEDFSAHPLIEAQLHHVVGWVYHNLGEWTKAEPHLARALDVRQRELGEKHEDTLASMGALGWVYHNCSRFKEAEVYLRRTVQAAADSLGPDHQLTLEAMAQLGMTLWWGQSRYRDAEAILQDALERCGNTGADDVRFKVLIALGWLYQGRSNEQSERVRLEALEMSTKTHGRDHPYTLTAMHGLGTLYSLHMKGRCDEAERLNSLALEGRRRLLGTQNPHTIASMLNVACTRRCQRRYDDAEVLLLETLDLAERVLGPDSKDTLTILSILGTNFSDRGEHERAVEMHRRALAGRMTALGEGHSETIGSMGKLTWTYLQLVRYDDARPVLLQWLKNCRRTHREAHPSTIRARCDAVWLASRYERLGRHHDAVDMFNQALDGAGQIVATAATLDSLNDLVWDVVRHATLDARLYRAALLLAEQVVSLKPDSPNELNTLGIAQYRAGDYRKALVSLLQSAALSEDEGRRQAEDWAFIAMAHHRLGHHREADAAMRQLRELMQDRQQSSDDDASAFLREVEAVLQANREDG